MYCLILICLLGELPVPIPWDDIPKEVASLKARVEKLESDSGIKTKRDVPIFKTADWCVNCPNIERTMKAAKFDFQKADPLPGESIPRVEWQGRYVEGDNPVEVLRLLNGDATAGQLISGSMSQSVSYSQPEVKTSRVAINYNAPRYTYPGSVKSHLMEDHGFSEADLAGMSHSDLVALHNTAHTNGSMASRSGNRRIFSGSRLFRGPRIRLFGGGGCPGGRCPN